MFDKRRDLLAEAPGILGAQVDFRIGAVDPEPHRLLWRTRQRIAA
jgi:hypothetical protein